MKKFKPNIDAAEKEAFESGGTKNEIQKLAMFHRMGQRVGYYDGYNEGKAEADSLRKTIKRLKMHKSALKSIIRELKQ